MSIGNWELMHECFPKHSLMVTARMKQDKSTDEEGKMRGVSMGRKKEGPPPKKNLDGLSVPNQNIIIIT